MCDSLSLFILCVHVKRLTRFFLIANRPQRDEGTSMTVIKRSSWSATSLPSCASTVVSELSIRTNETITAKVIWKGRKYFSFNAILLSMMKFLPALSIVLSAWAMRRFQLPREFSNFSIKRNGKHILMNISDCWMTARRSNAHIRDRNASMPSHPSWSWNSIFRMFIASSWPKASRGVGLSAKRTLCRLEERGLEWARTATQTWRSICGPNWHTTSWMRQRRCVADAALEHRPLLQSAHTVHLRQTLPRTRAWVPRRRRRRLYALT